MSNPGGIVGSDRGLSACIQLCQEKLYNPGLDVAINLNSNSILTYQRLIPDVRLGHTLTRHLPRNPPNAFQGQIVVWSTSRPHSVSSSSTSRNKSE